MYRYRESDLYMWEGERERFYFSTHSAKMKCSLVSLNNGLNYYRMTAYRERMYQLYFECLQN